MLPRLVEFPFEIPLIGDSLPSYFTMVTVGFLMAIIIIRRWAAPLLIDKQIMLDFVIWMAIWGVIGSRILHVVADGHFWDYVYVCLDPSRVDWKIDERECRALGGVWDVAKAVCHPAKTNCFAWADLASGGFAFYGGFIAAAIFSTYFIRKHDLPVGKILDMSGFTLMLGVAWGRIGCFLASCCFGVRTSSPIGVVFPGRSAASRHHWDQGWLPSYRLESLPVIPTQIYSAMAVFLIAAFAYFWLHPRKRFDGQVFCVSAALYAIFRFLIEFFRRDERGGLLGLSTSQIIAIFFIAFLIWLWRILSRRAERISQSAQ